MASNNEFLDILGVSEDLVPSPEHKQAGITELDFHGLLSPPLKIQEDLKEGCGGKIWEAGLLLTEYMLRHYKGKIGCSTVLELGAGGGIVGLAVALGELEVNGKSQEFPIHITDQIPMLGIMKQNIQLNELQGAVEASIYDWGDPIPRVKSGDTEGTQPDILLAADCVYFEASFPYLQKALQMLIGPKTVCYFCFKKRRDADMKFVRGLRRLFNVEEIEERGNYSDKGIYLWKITQKDE